MFSNPNYIVYLSGFVSMLIIIILAFIIVIKSEKNKKLLLAIDQIKNSLDQMDEQAKLIVRTDIELNKIQEELDKKISGLYVLQRLSRAFASTLDEKEIFNKIKSEHIEELGMQRVLAFIWQKKETKFLQYLNIGYDQTSLENIMRAIDNNHLAYLKIIKQEKTVSSLSNDSGIIPNQEIQDIFKVKDFCISPIVPKEGNHGFLFVGTVSEDIPVTEGDEELITILASSIGQGMENARLFEATWHAQQELERRVEQRTRELTDAVTELKKISKRKSDFVSAVSHELRTPLTSIKGYASILLGKGMGELPEALKERLEKINRHSDELVHMINDLLDITRLESGRVTMKKGTYNLKSLVENTVDLLSVQLKNKNLTLSSNIPPDINVVVDKSQIERVFVNLIGNAIKFTPAEGTISLTTRPAEKFIQVNISDSGIGIPKEAQEVIFEEFYRVDNPINDKVKGTGLGLSLVKNIIEAHQGLIWVESQVTKGSTFSMLLPTVEIVKK
ncbi:MAG: GAF domain-containing sensor histidine kinase [Candidatus Omnitrophota bacterium]